MVDLTPREPHRPLLWPDLVYQLQEIVGQEELYIVGGAVRDALLHRRLQDFDLAAPAEGAAWARRIANHLDGDFFVLDHERDVGRALVQTAQGRMTIDVARFRGAGLLADLTDRDFTMNAMAVDLRGDLRLLIDPLGGEAHIRAGLLRVCTPRSIANDPIRALRAVRQSLQQSLRIDPETLREIHDQAQALQRVSAERFRDELFKLLALPRPEAALRVADRLGLLGVRLPLVNALKHASGSDRAGNNGWQHTLAVIENLSRLLAAISAERSDNNVAAFAPGMLAMQTVLIRWQLQAHLESLWPNDRPHRALLMLAALLLAAARFTPNDSPSRETHAALLAANYGTLLALSSAEIDRLTHIVRYYPQLPVLETITPLNMHRFWWNAGSAGVDIGLLALAEYLAEAGHALDQMRWLTLVEQFRLLLEAYYLHHDEIVNPPPLVDGKMLMQTLGLPPGPAIGRLLTAIREAQVQGEARSVEDAITVARVRLAQD